MTTRSSPEVPKSNEPSAPDSVLRIQGEVVTERNASRFVKRRRPHAAVRRERSRSWRTRSAYYVVDDRSEGGGAPWCHATGSTAGKAWLQVARQMVAHDAEAAALARALGESIGQLRVAALRLAERPLVEPEPQFALEGAALCYAAERLDQYGSVAVSSDDRQRCVAALREMASEMDAARGPKEHSKR